MSPNGNFRRLEPCSDAIVRLRYKGAHWVGGLIFFVAIVLFAISAVIGLLRGRSSTL